MPPMTPDRRDVLKLMAASFALGGLTGCDPAAPDGHYIPAVVAPPGIVPGVPNFYATASVADGTALGIVVEHAMGRPIKIEGNPQHPSSLGSTDAIAQALILDFYDPYRSTAIQHQGRASERQSLLTAMLQQRSKLVDTRGSGLRLLTGPVSSPTLAASIAALLKAYPEAHWHVWDPFAPEAAREGAQRAYGRAVEVIPRLDKADVIVALESDLLCSAPGHVRFARDFAARRNPVRGPMSRVYALEATPSLIGAAADHRHAVGPGEISAIIAGLLAGSVSSGAPPWLAPMLADLHGAHGRAFVHAGPGLPADAHAAIFALNEALGGRGTTYDLYDPALEAADGLAGLTQALEAGSVEQLVILDCNPAFTAPGFEAAMRRVPWTLSSSTALDETGSAATWFVPQTHQFETWGDARAHDGTATITQPQSLPLYGAMSPLALLSLLVGPSEANPLAAVQQSWRDHDWNGSLAAGLVAGTAHTALDVRLRSGIAAPAAPVAQDVHLLVRADPYLGDGRWANLGWLQELPRAQTKLTWDNPLLIAPALAARLKVGNGDNLLLRNGDRQAVLPAWIVPGQAADCVIAHAGNGRRVTGDVGSGAGFDAYPLRALVGAGLQITKAEGRVPLATTDRHYGLAADTSDILRHRTLTQFQNGDYATAPANPDPARLLFRREPDAEVQWGMSIDLNACIGCNACVVACQAENNVPVVGKDSVLLHREMHWIRIDRYDIGDDHPSFQPVMCMHCEQAPCEVVCPVEATQHDSEGLNLMVYNRCVGTRFCSNNCPYKVRRFNYAAYADAEQRPPIARNPDVTARGRGVMEKCTFCVQRIAQARIAHDRDGVPEQTNTACAAVCPTQAITFGDINDRTSAVTKRKQSPIDYPLLPETSAFPRVTYEARILNTHDETAG